MRLALRSSSSLWLARNAILLWREQRAIAVWLLFSDAAHCSLLRGV